MIVVKEYIIFSIIITFLIVNGIVSAFSWKEKLDFKDATWNLQYVYEFVRHMTKPAYDDFSGVGAAMLPQWLHEPMKLARETRSSGLLGGSPAYTMSFSRSCQGCKDLQGMVCGTQDSGGHFFTTLLGPVGDSSESLLGKIHASVVESGWSPECWDPSSACLKWDESDRRLTLGWERWLENPPADSVQPSCSVRRGGGFK